MPPADPDDPTFLHEFESQRWPLDHWHHRDHVKLAYLYLRKYSLQEASTRLPAAIRSHNAVHHIPDSLTSGYHETMTQAWLRLIHTTLCQYGPADSADAFYDAHPELHQPKTL